jgi:hypothetical protein
MFTFVHKETDCGIEHILEDYVSLRTTQMKHFGYKTIPTILMNLDNLNFNVILHNEYYAALILETERPDPFNLFPTAELTAITCFGIHVMDQHAKQQQQQLLYRAIAPTADVYTRPVSQTTLHTLESLIDSADLRATTTTINDTDTSTPVITDALVPTEYCFAMKGNKWNFHHHNTSNNQHMMTPSPIAKAMRMHGVRRHVWLGDSGSSCHFTIDDTGMFQWRKIHDPIQVGDGSTVFAVKEGDVSLEVRQKNGQRCHITLEGCKYIPNLPTNLFSITQAISKGWQLGNKGLHIALNKADRHIIFDTVDPSATGVIMQVTKVPISPHATITKRSMACSMIDVATPQIILPDDWLPSSNPVHTKSFEKRFQTQRTQRFQTQAPSTKMNRQATKPFVHRKSEHHQKQTLPTDIQLWDYLQISRIRADESSSESIKSCVLLS